MPLKPGYLPTKGWARPPNYGMFGIVIILVEKVYSDPVTQPPLRCRRFAYGYALDSCEFRPSSGLASIFKNMEAI